MSLEPYQIRVIQEKQELDQKLEKLTTYLESRHFAELPFDDKWLLREQRDVMKAYSRILGSRIQKFNQPPKESA